MKIERVKNAKRNIIFGVLLKIYQIAMPFLMRTVMLYFLGVKYLGLNGLFSSILQVLNLAELGVGNAMVYSMYKPIVEDDSEKICALMKLYRTYYRVIGMVIAALGVIALPFIPRLVADEIPSELNIYVLYLLNLGCTVLSYWLFGYKNCLFTAHQREDMVSKMQLIASTVQYVLQLVVLFVLQDYYVYLIIALAAQALTNILTAVAADKVYPDYRPRGTLEKNAIREINGRIRDLFTAKVSGVIVYSADTIVVSAFLGLTTLAMYQNYYFILTSVHGIVSVVFHSCLAGIGNSVIVETKEKNYRDIKKFTFIIVWIAGFCSCCMLCLYQPFMTLWAGEELLFEMSVVICFCVYYFVFELNRLLEIYKDAAGMWRADRFRPLVTAVANLTMNLITVKFWGVYGVLLSTVVSMLFIGMPWMLHNLFTLLFSRDRIGEYVKSLVTYTVVSAVGCAVTFALCQFISGGSLTQLIARAAVCCVVPNILFYLCYRNREQFGESVALINKMTGGKLKLKWLSPDRKK